MNPADNAIFENKKILVGITGSIAAYKAAEICSKLVKLKAEVFPVLTPNALNFINPLTFSTITRNKAIFEQFKNNDRIYHISLSHSADLILIAPATANTISKLANGICDNFLTTAIISSTCPVCVAPAMNQTMYFNDAVYNNILKLKKSGKYFFVEPQKGWLACGEEGTGRLADYETILETISDLLTLKNDFKGKKILITTGGTKEFIDSVRFISNRSSGKMGCELAKEAYFRGADRVILISANANIEIPSGIELIIAQDTDRILYEVNKFYKDMDIIIMAAAISDIVPVEKYDYKLKKNDGLLSNLKFRENINILNTLSEKKKRGQFLVGFSAESGEKINNTKEKMKNKNIDIMVLNDISRNDIGFDSNYNEVTVITGNMEEIKIEKNTKRIIARNILNIIKNKIN